MNELAELPLQIGNHRLRNRLVLLGFVVVLLAAAGFGIWDTTLKASGSTSPKLETAAVTPGTVRTTISATGTVSAQSSTSLSFQQSGTVTQVNVKLGQQVHQGDVLAQLDTSALQNSVSVAQANLDAANIKLHQLMTGNTPDVLAAADQSVVSAQSALDKANNDYTDLTNPTASTAAAAQQAVTAAQAQLDQAQAARARLDPAPADIAAAQAAVAQAQSQVTSAQNTDQAAANNLVSVQASLQSAETAYCALPVDATLPTVSFCGVAEAPLSGADQQALMTVTYRGNTAHASAASQVLSANTTYNNAVIAKNTADATLTSAQAALASAQQKLAQAQAPASPQDIAAADAAVSAAQQGLDTANAKLNDLNSPSQTALANAQDAVASAQSALDAAQAKRTQAYAGPTADDIALQQNQVQLAQLQVDAANINLQKAEIVAPYDGTVAALNVHAGDLAGGGGSGSSSSSTSGASASAPIVLSTPNTVMLNLTIGETDIANLQVGETGFATLDAISGRIFPIHIDAIGGTPTVTQGVTTYTAQASILSGAQAAQAFGNGGASAFFGGNGGNRGNGGTGGTGGTGGRQRGSASAQATPGAGQATPGGDQQPQPTAMPDTRQPEPGMNANVTIIVQQHSNVLTVPARAIQRQGRDSVVQVQGDNGSTQTGTVTTGLTDGTNTEITSGLSEGQTVILPALTGTTQTGTGTGNGTGTGTNQNRGGAGGAFAPPANGIPGGVR